MFPPIVTRHSALCLLQPRDSRLQALRHPARTRADPRLHRASARALDDDRLLPRYPARHGGGGARRRRQPLRPCCARSPFRWRRPGLAATFILVFISSWNEFLLALILTGSRSQTLPIAVAGQIAQYDVKYGNMMAAGVITTVPVLVLALLTQRYLTRGLARGRGHRMIGDRPDRRAWRGPLGPGHLRARRQALRQRHRRRRPEPRRRQRRDAGAARSVRLRQDDVAADAGRAGVDQRRA